VPGADLALLFSASRLALVLTGVLSTYLLASGLAVQRGNLVYHRAESRALDIWARWDSEWYLLIAGQGYAAQEHFADLGANYEPEATAGFLPLYPVLIRLAAPLLGPVGAGVAISNACLMAALLILYRLTRAQAGEESGHVAGIAACAALLVFPMSLFLSAVYSESLFLMLALIVFERSTKGRLAAAGTAGALAALTRPTGVLLALPIAIEWWTARRRDSGAPASGILWALAPPAGLACFLVYCGRVFGDPLALVRRQQRWRGSMSGPWRAFTRWWESGPAPHGAHDSTVELILALFVLAMLPFVYRRLRPSYSLWATAMVLLPLSSTLWSFGRFALTIFPVFMVLGIAATGRHWRWAALYGVVGATSSGLFKALFANWWWAG